MELPIRINIDRTSQVTMNAMRYTAYVGTRFVYLRTLNCPTLHTPAAPLQAPAENGLDGWAGT